MSPVGIALTDLEPFADIESAKALAMIEDALALAARVAPCILEPDFEFEGAARAIIRGAILRWNEAGTGALSTYAVGQVSQGLDTRQPRRGMFWPSEIDGLQRLCSASGTQAFAIDTQPAVIGANHADICTLNFGAVYCSCGAVLTAGLYPLYEI